MHLHNETARYGKPSGNIIDLRRRFWDPVGQDEAHRENLEIVALYRQQPLRTACKNCAAAQGAPTFRKQEIDYFLCDRCGHLNGAFEDTEAFYAAQFTDAGGVHAAQHYSAPSPEAYQERVNSIYAPKVDFLFDRIRQAGDDPRALTYLDIGAGTGHFVSALRAAGAQASGLEVSDRMVRAGNDIIGKEALRPLDIFDIGRVAAETDAAVVTMIFVLEHVLMPTDVMRTFAANPNIRYLLVAVPVHSPASYIEMMFPTIYERHLSAHTHLYTDRSLAWLERETGFDRIGEWWFGADMMDLLRSFANRMHQLGQPAAAAEDWMSMFAPMIDDMQLAVDRRKLSSEVHLVLRPAAS